MGIKEFSEIKEYIFLLIILMFLEDKNKEEQFILSNITEYIENNYPDEKIDWTIFKNRKSLIADMVEKGEVDFIALGRPIMNQPNFAEGLLEKIKNQSWVN